MAQRAIVQARRRFAASMVVAGCLVGFLPETSLAQFSSKERTIKLDGQDFAFSVSTTQDGKEFGYFLPSARWPRSADGTTTVYVCWESPSSAFSNDYKAVESAATSTWQDHSRLIFRGWQPCAPSSSGIRIRVSDEGPHTIGLGNELDGRNGGMVLNFTFNNWSPTCKATLSYCIKAIAVHEFGHAIGFAHEQNRPDTPGECRQPPQGESEGSVMLTPYDPHSVMNYCNEKWNNEGNLSDLDIVALQRVYGAKP